MTTTTQKTLHGIPLRPRKHIRPKVEVTVKTAAGKRRVVTAARRVIEEHRDVLIALRDR